MKAMILAAGRGQRLRPLTDTCPKPLLAVAGKPLIQWHLEALAAAGIGEVIINTAWLAEQFPLALGDGARWGLSIRYVWEGHSGLETGGGLLNALNLLGPEPFLLLNGDIHTDADLSRLHLAPGDLAQLLLVTPPAGSAGDFSLDAHGRAGPGDAHDHSDAPRLTYAGIGLIHPALFAGWRAAYAAEEASGHPPAFRLAPLLRHAMRRQRVGALHHRGHWTDAGTPQRLAELDAALRPG